MKRRSAFTLVEMLAVIGILAILLAILVPIINHVRRIGFIEGEKLDFQAIATGLESYRQSFGDYPRNTILPTWNSTPNNPPSPNAPLPPPPFPALAIALLGPGPAIPSQVTTNYLGAVTQDNFAGDGADGLGFRDRLTKIPLALTANPPAGSPLLAVTLPVGYTLHFATGQCSVDLSPGKWYEEVIGIQSIAPLKANNTYTSADGAITLNFQTGFTIVSPFHLQSDSYSLRTANGKSYAPLLPADRFKVAYVDPNIPAGAYHDVPANIHQPVLLDRWGNPIQYFTRFGPNSFRANLSLAPDSSYVGNYTAYGLLAWPPAPLPSIGPLLGYSTSVKIDNGSMPSIATPYGSDSIWDQRDAVPFVDTTGINDSPSVVTVRPWAAGSADYRYDYTMAFKWMLGDEPTIDSTGKTTGPDNFISPVSNNDETAETLRYTGPYILISAGPDGRYCSFESTSDPNFATLIQPSEWNKRFIDRANVYNFDR